eukprot:350435-Chlamydomonas_euryale.AAC.7
MRASTGAWAHGRKGRMGACAHARMGACTRAQRMGACMRVHARAWPYGHVHSSAHAWARTGPAHMGARLG